MSQRLLLWSVPHLAVCVSSQAGCAQACSFCSTGMMGFKRHLTTDEILMQVSGWESNQLQGGGEKGIWWLDTKHVWGCFTRCTWRCGSRGRRAWHRSGTSSSWAW